MNAGIHTWMPAELFFAIRFEQTKLLLLDLPVFLFELLNGLADQVDHFSVGRAALVLRNKVQFIVKLAVNAQPEVLILFLLQRIHVMPSMYLIKDNLSLFQVHDRMCKMYLL